jgi:hypothetical protein
MKELTAQAVNPLVVAGGTSYTGSAISETNHGELVNAMYKAMGVKYAAVGNHDFDWSDVNTRDAVFSGWEEQGGFKFLNANVYWTTEERGAEHTFLPYDIVEIAGVKVVARRDYKPGTETDVATGKVTEMELKGSNVLRYRLADGTELVVRPSGTEPKLKAYLFSHGADQADAAARLEALEPLVASLCG